MRGLAYSVFSFASHHADAGLVGRLGRLPAGQARRRPRRRCRAELAKVAADGITEEELERGKGQLRGGLVLGLEDSGSRMSRIGKAELVHDELLGIDEVIAPGRRGHPSTTSARSRRRAVLAARDPGGRRTRLTGTVAIDVEWVTERLDVEGKALYCQRSVGGGGVPVVHIHGFAISGAYLMPTARALAGRRVNLVPDLPGYGRSERRGKVLDIPALSEALLAVLDALEIEQAVLVGNSMGCPIGLEVAHVAPERVHSLVLVSPAGGVQNQPLYRALGQLAKDVVRESPRMFPVALPDYLRFGPVDGLRLFHELTLFPSLDRLLHTPVPTLAVLGGRDPLMPPPSRVREVGRLAHEKVSIAVIERAAHAVNFSHPEELAPGDRAVAGRRAGR